MSPSNLEKFNVSLQVTPDAESPSTSTVASSHQDSFPQLVTNGHAHHHHHGAGSAQAQAAAQPMPPLPGATVYTPTAPPSTEVNPRSCVTCRRRKVRCDKLMPCTNCRRAMVPCIFPPPERAPRRPRRKDPMLALGKPHQSSEREIELLKRLRKLEGIVEDLSGQVELETSSGRVPTSSSNSPEATTGGAANESQPRSSLDHASGANTSGIWSQSPNLANVSQADSSAGSPGRLIGRNTSHGSLIKQTKDTQKQLGRLMINDRGRSRYVSSAFWTKINDELDELRAETQRISVSESEESDGDSSHSPDEDRPMSDHQAFIFGFRSSAIDLRSFHPLPSQIPYIWQVYQENVDPVVKILHIPTATKVIREARTNLSNISPAAEALMFAIYYAAVSSLEEHEIETNFMTEKSILVNKYRFALEQALAKANFLISADLVTMQAFVLLIVLARSREDSRLAWSLTGLAIRIGNSIGLHRDGTNFPNLSPFETEMRRRLFWALCILDIRCAEDQGTDLSIFDQGVDTLPPLNINDADISPDSTSLPTAREGTTDMTFALIRYEICRVARRLHAIHSAMGPIEPSDASLSLEERESMIHDVYNRVENLYLKRGGNPDNSPMFWVAATITRVICAKMTLVIYQPVMLTGPSKESIPRDVRNRLFIACTELFEYSYLLNRDPRVRQWRWLFQTYGQWQAIAYVLIESCRRPWTASVERSWNGLNSIMSTSKNEHEKMSNNTSLFVPLKTLYSKARKYRNAEIERLRGNIDEISRLDKEDRARLNPTMFSAYYGTLDGLQWRERWLRLVGAPQLIDEPASAQPLESLPSAAPSMNAVAQDASTNGLQMQQQLPQPFGPQQQQQKQPILSSQNDESQLASHCHDNIMNQVFAQPTFQPSDLAPFFYMHNSLNPQHNGSNTSSGAVGPESVFGTFSGTDMPRQDQALAAFATGQPTVSLPGETGDANGVAATAAQPNTTPLVNALVKDYPPPWLWSPSVDGNNVAQFPSMLSDGNDADTRMDDMDDNFDWQDFSQTLGGMSRGVWSSHGL